MKRSHALVLLDHEPLVWGHYNKAVAALAEGKKLATVEFIPGIHNPADYPSRGREIPEEVREGILRGNWKDS